ncbi:MAG TPA: alpha/beta hydrolase [Bryobacteraceae bacterium]|nr:alpha/beta hydrolase [Bryobacteraceae bacterium]
MTGFVHRFVPAERENAPIALLLHGTGGNEDDLLPLGQRLLPGAAILSPRGQVLENGMPRFFRRFAEGVFDVDDLKRRTDELAVFIDLARLQYGLGERKVVAVGYSNGANIAASLILRHPGYVSAAVLFRAMVPFRPEMPPALAGVSVLLAAGRNDTIVPAASTGELVRIFEAGGAQVAVHWHEGGHELGEDDVEAARFWLARSGGAISA